MSISYTTSQNIELFWEGSHCLNSIVICDSRFESQIAIAVKSRDLEHLAQEACKMSNSRGVAKGWFQKGGFGGCSLHPPRQERGYKKKGRRCQKPERGHIRQNHPFTKPPFCFLPNSIHAGPTSVRFGRWRVLTCWAGSGWGQSNLSFLLGKSLKKGLKPYGLNFGLPRGAEKNPVLVIASASVRFRPSTLRAQRLKKINLAWNFQSRLKISIRIEIFNPDLQNSPQKNRGMVGGLLQIFNLAWKFQDLNFFRSLGP